MRLATVFAAVALLSLPLPATATPINSAGLTRGELATYLKSKGYPVNATKDGNGLSILRSKTSDGIDFDIYFFDCGKTDERCGSLQFAAGWAARQRVTLDQLNAWNRGHRYMRAYLTDNGDLYGEFDMVIAPGGTTEQLDDDRRLFDTMLAKFKTHFGL